MIGWCSAKLIFRFRHVSVNLTFRFPAFLDFVQFSVHGLTYFRDESSCVQSNTYYVYKYFIFRSDTLVWIHPILSYSSATFTRDVARLFNGDGLLLRSQSLFTAPCFQRFSEMSAQASPRDESSVSSCVIGTSASSSAGNTSTKLLQQLVQSAQAPSDGQRPRTLSSPVWLHFEPYSIEANGKKTFA